MPRVLIQPCASKEARDNWKKTMDVAIHYQDQPYREALTSEQLSGLRSVHVADQANFWGATAFHDSWMPRVRVGDIVLFAWNHKIRAIGEVGYAFRNQGFADLLWKGDDSTASFVNVYSLLSFADSDFSYELLPEPIRPAPGQGPRPGRLVEDDDLVDKIIDEFGIETSSAKSWEEEAEEDYGPGLLADSIVRELEKHRSGHRRAAGGTQPIAVGNVESALVHEYVEWDKGHSFQRFSCSAGVTDLHTEDDGKVNLFEAKGGNSTKRVREAVAQLLHYAPYSNKPVARLTALFPDQPKPADVAYLHRLGIDCVFRVAPHQFNRKEAPVDRRAYMEPVWNDAGG